MSGWQGNDSLFLTIIKKHADEPACFRPPSLLLPAWDATLCTLESIAQGRAKWLCDRGLPCIRVYLSTGTYLSNYMQLGLHVADGYREERLKLAINEDGETRQESPRRVFCILGKLSL